jgi:lipopolysaccharide/colanic/teichoic acid biosynthesis glycosyltransferase
MRGILTLPRPDYTPVPVDSMFRVFNVNVPSRVMLLFLLEVALLTASFVGAAALDPDIGDLDAFVQFEGGAYRMGAVVAIILLGLYFRDLYAQVAIRNRIALVQELCLVFGLAFFVQGAINYLSHDWTLPRKIMILGSVFSFVGVLALRLLFAYASAGATPATRLLFLGVSPTIERIDSFLTRHPEMGIEVAGYLEDESRSPVETPMNRLGSVRDLDAAIESVQPLLLVIAHREAVKPGWAHEFLELHFGGIHTEDAASLYERLLGRVRASELNPRDLVVGNAFIPGQVTLNLHNIISATVAGIALILTLPLLLAVGLVLKLSSREPVLLREARVGLRGRVFRMLSFRDAGPKSLFRRTGLSRLPRLINVLKGDMAIVGPAPAAPSFSERLAEQLPVYALRQNVRPGLTGWAQIYAPTALTNSILEIEYDLYYVRNFSLSLDFAVLLLWLRKQLFGDLAAV